MTREKKWSLLLFDNRLVLESKNSGTENAIEVGGTMGGSKLGLFESGAFKNVFTNRLGCFLLQSMG